MAPVSSASFQTKLFLAALATALLALVVAGALFGVSVRRQTNERVEQGLISEARLAAELLSRLPAEGDVPAYDAEADRIGALLDARVTLVAADGTVLGDSAESLAEVAGMDNHGTRPEIVAARDRAIGIARRSSDTVDQEMLYVAVAASHPRVAFVRVSVPLTTIGQQIRSLVLASLAALGLALLGAATVAAILANRIGQRVRAIACDRATLPARRPHTAAARLRRRRARRRGSRAR